MQLGTRERPRWAGILAALSIFHLGSGCGPDDGPGGQPPRDAGPDATPDAIPGPPPACEPDTSDGEVPLGVAVVFPPAGSLTDAAEIKVRGTARLDAEVSAIRVNGVPAESADGFRHWQVSVPLAPGANTLTIESEDGNGLTDPAAAQTTVVGAPNPFLAPVALVLDAPRNRALVLDQGLYAGIELKAVDLDTGIRTIQYERPPELEDGNRFADMALLGEDGQRVLVASTAELFTVDLTTGERVVISGATAGSGPLLMEVVDMALDAAGGRALVVQNEEQPALIAVDLTTGARSLLADLSLDSGAAARPSSPGPGHVSAANGLVPLPPPEPYLAWAVALDAQAGRALVLLGYRYDMALVAVDLASGARSVISDNATGTGPALEDPGDLALDPANDRVLVTLPGHGTLLAIDLGTGNRTIVSEGRSDNAGTLLSVPRRLALDAEQRRALVLDSGRHTLVAVDLATGDRTLVSGHSAGSGHALRSPVSVAVDAQARRALIGDYAEHELVAVDLATGDRTLLAGMSDVYSSYGVLDIDARTGRILALTAESIVAFDPATGERTVISDYAIDSGPVPFGELFLTVDETGDRVLLSTLEGIMSVDLGSGVRTLLDTTIDTMDEWYQLSIAWMALQPECNRILMASDLSVVQSLLTLVLDTGRIYTVTDYADCAGTSPHLLQTPVYDPATGRVLGWSYFDPTLMAIDTRTGACTTQVRLEPGKGGPWPFPRRAAALDPTTGLLLLLDDESQALLAMDPETGERVIVSR
jgi:DNA-binding beta-propeller fold protein YncE